MINFNFYNPARIVFGKGRELEAGTLVKKYGGKKVLFHYGGGSIKKTGLYDKVIKVLKEEGIAFAELGGVVPNPRLSLVREGIKLCKEQNIDFILAVGGGSVIDSAKAIAAGVFADHDVWDFYTKKAMAPQKALPIGVILTIPAAGSETSSGSVITNDENWLKRSMGSEVLIPKFAILNPELTYSLPAYQTACGASDIMAHLMERYFTNVTHVDYTDRLIEASLRTVLNFAPKVLEEPDNYDARAEMMWVGTIAHSNLLSTGRIGDWGSHDIEHELSGAYDIAHGAGLSIIFPAWMKYVYKENPGRFVQFAVRVFDVDLAFENQEEIILEGIRRLESFYKRIGLPTRLKDVNIGEERLREMADKAMIGRDTFGNFKNLTSEDIYNIYRLAL